MHTLSGGCCQSLTFLCNKHWGEEITISLFPFTSAAQEQKEERILRSLLQRSKAFFYCLWPSSFILTKGEKKTKKKLKGTLSKLLGLKIDLPWQCSHLDGLISRSANPLSPYTHQSFHQSGSTGTPQPKGHPSPHNLFWDAQVWITYNWQGTVVSSIFLFHTCKSIAASYPSKKIGISSLSKPLDICCHN